jgi:hypothetical protein
MAVSLSSGIGRLPMPSGPRARHAFLDAGGDLAGDRGGLARILGEQQLDETRAVQRGTGA